MKGIRNMESPEQAKAGDTNIVAGVTYIFSGRDWLPYPMAAHDLIQLAQNHGWGFDDGLPPRKSADGTVYVRVLIGREKGENALIPGEMVPGVQFHAVWSMPNPLRPQDRGKTSWILGAVHVKTSDADGWKLSRSLKSIRSRIESEPVQVPDGYVSVSV